MAKAALNLSTWAFHLSAWDADRDFFMDEHNIPAAVQACLRDAHKSDKPFRAINDSLATLKSRGWTEAERLEVQTQVLQELKRRRRTVE